MEFHLAFNDLGHRRIHVRWPQTNRFVERFHRTVLDEFFRSALRTALYETVEALQANLDIWLQSYNYQHPHQGYRNRGMRPVERTEQFRIQ